MGRVFIHNDSRWPLAIAMITLWVCTMGAAHAQSTPLQQKLRNPTNVAPPGSERDQADQWLQEGRRLEESGLLREAIATWQKALDRYQALGDVPAQGIVYTYLGEAYWATGQLTKAEDAFRRRLAIARDRGDQHGQIYALNSLGRVLLQRGGVQAAKTLFDEALNFALSTQNRQGEAQSRDSLGLLAFFQRDYQKAADHYQQSLRASRRAGDTVMEATTLNLLGQLYQTQVDGIEASKYYGLAVRLSRLNRDRANQLIAIDGLVRIFNQRQSYRQSLELLTERLDIAQFRENAPLELDTLQKLAETYQLAGETSAARQAYEAAIALAQALQDTQREARLRLQLSNMEQRRR